MTQTRGRHAALVAALLAGVAIHPAFAAEGRIPIPFVSPPVTPVSISAPGRYILTRNLAPTGPGNTINIAVPGTGGDVDLDLNGFLVTGNAGANVINVTMAGGATSEVKIHDGALQGGAISINVVGAARQVVIDGIRSGNAATTGINITDAVNVVVRDSVITNAGGTGIAIGGATTKQVTIERNLIQSCPVGIGAAANSSVTIVSNRLTQTSTTAIDLSTTPTCLVAENTIRTAGSFGIALRNVPGSKVFDNVVSGCTTAGILLDINAVGNLIWKNVVQGTAVAILVQGDTNQIEGNVMNNNVCGLVLAAGADNNVYRGNTARGNTGSPTCAAGGCAPNFTNAGAGNSTPGDNFIPTGVAPCN